MENQFDFGRLYEEFNSWDADFRADLGLDTANYEMNFEDDLNEFAARKKNKMKHLTNEDYTLNSPLVADNINAFREFIMTGSCAPIFKRSDWDDLSNGMKQFGLPSSGLQSGSSFHKWFARLTKDHWENDLVDKIITITNQDASDTFEIPKVFSSAWLNIPINFKERVNVHPATKKSGSIFLTFHYLTLGLNCATKSEMDNLIKLIGCEARETSEGFFIFKWNHKTLGQIIFGKGMCWIEKGSQLLDRNMLLMVKDVHGGRFQAMLHIQYKEYPEYHPEHLASIIRLFKVGDNIISSYGSSGYKAIKMIEPLVMGELQSRVEQSRPLIPKFHHFSEHLRQEITTLAETMVEIIGFHSEIHTSPDIDSLLTCYGLFRLWGHPFIDYMDGLRQMNSYTTKKLDIDEDYADKLGSDLALIVLRHKYRTEKKWYVDVDQLEDGHYLKSYVQTNTWPTAEQIAGMPETWNKLPLLKCFDIPDMIDPSMIYSDKRHSMDLDEIVDFLLNTNYQTPIQTKSVLRSQMEREATDIKQFLQNINDRGLPLKELVIGLRAKERELKLVGRFFALMTWSLREYFVITELLIKKHFVPLCKGLTMADDYNTVMSKMIQASEGQSTDGYDNVTIANHVDYSKWNNHQRKEANNPVFRVMGQFVGMPELFCRTHEFFESALYYYRDRPDLMIVEGGNIRNRGPDLVCWKGQPGGCEGLRQKGWSVVNYLALLRESKKWNTRMRYLMQGDNQVICTFYKTRSSRSQEEMEGYLNDIHSNNNAIMEAIQVGTQKLGLIFNNDETLQSSQLMVYGKVILINGSITGLPEKRLSRCLCTTNDQLPSIGSVSGTVVTNALTVCNYSETFLNAIIQYNWIGNYARNLLELHNPALRGPHPKWEVRGGKIVYDRRFKIRYLYLDPSLGGVGGVSLPRFTIRQFPDQITEGLSFWKLIHDNTKDSDIKNLALECGHPRLCTYDTSHFPKLMENPSSLNLLTGFSVLSVVKNKIKDALLSGDIQIKNHVLASAIETASNHDETLMLVLERSTPCFPRFLSEFRSSSFYGIVENFTGMFINSRTIRTILSHHLGLELDDKVIASEKASLAQLAYVPSNSDSKFSQWDCSSSKADELRELSWGRPILGATVPHPLELMGSVKRVEADCLDCNRAELFSDRVTIRIHYPFPEVYSGRGPYRPYLGSKTSETTSLIQPWERETNIPIIKKAFSMRRVINWFVKPDSKMAEAIYENIKSLTGEDAREAALGFKRTGSGLHRFACSRQSNGGFSAVAPNLASHMIMTSDTMNYTAQSNYDFMYQSLLLFAQVGAVTVHSLQEKGGTYHIHINCKMCLREITEPEIDTPIDCKFPDMSSLLNSWKPDSVQWYREKPSIKLVTGDWKGLHNEEKSRQVGSILAFYHSDKIATSADQLADLFPVVLKSKLDPIPFLEGICLGLCRASGMQLLRRPSIYRGSGYREALYASLYESTKELCSNPAFLSLCSTGYLTEIISTCSHKIPASYPLSMEELGQILSTYIRTIYKSQLSSGRLRNHLLMPLWLFSEFLDSEIAGPYILSTNVLMTLIKPKIKTADINLLKASNRDETLLRSKEVDSDLINKLTASNSVLLCQEEVRHACKSMIPPVKYTSSPVFPVFYEGYISIPRSHKLTYSLEKSNVWNLISAPPDLRDPTISGLRLPQISTGAFLKFRGILDHYQIQYQDYLCGGDGSGGLTSSLARRNLSSKFIFNSLFEGDMNHSKGVTPSPPSALSHMPLSIYSRCVNYSDCWQKPSDLSHSETWTYFKSEVIKHRLYLDMIVLDMQVVSEEAIKAIEINVLSNIGVILRPLGTCIIKTYLGRIIKTKGEFIESLGKSFQEIHLCQAGIAGSFTSEIYVVCINKFPSPFSAGFINWAKSLQWMNRSYCYRSVESEFRRALNHFNQDTLLNIPNVYIPTLENETEDILDYLGLDPTVRTLIINKAFSKLELATVESVLEFYVQVSLAVIPTKTTSLAYPLVPSDMKLIRYFSFEIGVHIWISLKSKNLWLYNRCYRYLQNKMSFFYDIPELGDKSHFLIWSHESFSRNAKTLRLDSMHGFIGRVVRWLSRVSTTYQPSIDIQQFKANILQNGHSSYCWPYIQRSGCLELLGDREVNVDGDVNTFVRIDA